MGISGLFIISSSLCVCVCVRERERERESGGNVGGFPYKLACVNTFFARVDLSHRNTVVRTLAEILHSPSLNLTLNLNLIPNLTLKQSPNRQTAL